MRQEGRVLWKICKNRFFNNASLSPCGIASKRLGVTRVSPEFDVSNIGKVCLLGML
jgi:hypothetical protein